MTVKELIDQLSTMSPDVDVVVEVSADVDISAIERVEETSVGVVITLDW